MKYYTNQGYILRNIAGESVLVSIGSGVADFCGIINLNGTAKDIWTMLQSGASKQELIDSFVEKYEVSTDKATEDIENTLKILQERGMITCA